MFKLLLLALIVVPFLELYLLLAIGREVGLVPTLALVLVSGLVGSWLARREGRRVLTRWTESMARGRVPEEGILSGALVLAGGALLVVPGVLTDVLGLVLLLPPTRRLVAARVRRSLERKVREGSVHVTTVGFGGFGVPRGDGPFSGNVFDDGPGAQSRLRQSQSEVDAEFTEEKPGN